MGRETDTTGLAKLHFQALSSRDQEFTGISKCKFLPGLASFHNRHWSRSIYLKSCLTCRQHEWFVKFNSAYEDTHYMYISMEYIPMGDMSQSLADGYRWNESDTRVVIKQLLRGLAVMHKKGITHRDLKPEVYTPPLLKYSCQNLMVTRTYSSTFQRIKPMSSASKSVTLVPQSASHSPTPPLIRKPPLVHRVTWHPKCMTHRNRRPTEWTSGPSGVSCIGCSPAISYLKTRSR